MAIDNRYDEEDVDGAMCFQKGEITTSTQSNPTHNSTAHGEAIHRDTHREVDREVNVVNQDSTEAAIRERNHEVHRKVTEADFQR